MPRIRKKKSRRQSTQQRSKIHHKSVETRKKNRKESKKNPQWKSKKKADPGIPNSFPFKDQILAEVAAERRQAEEAKIARKEASKRPVEDKEEDTPGITSLRTSSVYASKPNGSAVNVRSTGEDAPQLVDTSLATLQDVLDRADVILQVVDARDIMGGRNVWLENRLSETGGKHALLVNKADLVPREALEGWLRHLSAETYLFAAPPQDQPSSSTARSIGREQLLAVFQGWSQKRESQDKDLIVALLGLPSVGKTSILNALLPRDSSKYAVALPVPLASSAKTPQPTTRAPIQVTLDLEDGLKVDIIDTPGWDVVPTEVEDEDGEELPESDPKWDDLEVQAMADVLRRNLGRVDRIKDARPLAQYIVERSNSQDLMLLFNTPTFEEGNTEAFLTSLARINARLKKGDQPDLAAASRVILRDWALNQYPYYSTPPAKDSVPLGSEFPTEISEVLDKCRSRKEMRAASRGIVRFRGNSTPDTREIILDDDYVASFEPSDDEDEDEEDDDDDMDHEEDDAEDEEDDSSGEGEDPFESDAMALDDLAEQDDEEGDMIDPEEFDVSRETRKAAKPTKGKKVSFANGTRGGAKMESQKEVKSLLKKGKTAGRRR